MRSLGKSFQLAATALASVIALTACGGSDGGGTPSPTPTPTPGASVSKGVITAKGSVFVNGIKFTTTGATITIDDNPGTEADLKVGMVVKVGGASDDAAKTGTALKIEARDALEGEIESVDAINKTITVMGQVVHIEDNLTRLNDDDAVKVFSATGFVPGNIVEVHGFADDNGGLRATRVAKKTTGEFEAKGFVTGLGTASFGLSLTPTGASFATVNFTAGMLPVGTANGSMVEVKSLTVPAAPVAPAVVKTITASLIKFEDNKLGLAGEKVEVEGLVSSGTVDSFTINGQKVVTNSSTMFEGGVKADFLLGGKLEAEGPLDASGAIVATKISFRSNIRLEAVPSVVTASGLTLLGKSIAINKFTRMDTGITTSSQVEVRAMLDRDGNLVATRVVNRGTADGKAFLQGPVTVSGSAMTILGVPVVTDAATQFRISTDAPVDQAVSSANFFAQVKSGLTVVKVRWDNFTVLTAPVKEAEIELGSK